MLLRSGSQVIGFELSGWKLARRLLQWRAGLSPGLLPRRRLLLLQGCH